MQEKDRKWILEEIGNATKRPELHGLKRFFAWLREWSLVGPVLAAFLALLALAGAGWYYALSRVDKEARFEQSTTDRLSNIEQTLKVLPAQVAASNLSNLPHQDLKAHRDELKKIKQTLAASPDKDAPNFWPTSFQILTLFSQASFEEEMFAKIAATPEGLLDDVGSNPPGGMGPIKNSRVLLRHLIQGLTFINSIVRFDPTVRLANVTFINCIFIFPPEANPSRPLQEIGNTLLASDLSHVVLNAS